MLMASQFGEESLKALRKFAKSQYEQGQYEEAAKNLTIAMSLSLNEEGER